jgi:hypothetical protein
MSSLALIALAVSRLAPGRLSNDGGRCVRFRYGAGRREDYGAGSHKERPSSDSAALSIFAQYRRRSDRARIRWWPKGPA